jgi:hypothetical protein
MMPTVRDGDAERPIHRRIQARSRLLAGLFTGLLWLVDRLTAAVRAGGAVLQRPKCAS